MIDNHAFAQQIKTLSDTQLKKLRTILEHLQRFSHLSLDQIVASLASKPTVTSADVDLVSARIYELQIYEGLTDATATERAMEEFRNGTLTHPPKPKKSIPRRKSKPLASKPDASAAPAQAARSAHDPEPLGEHPPCKPALELPASLQIETLMHSKFFHNSPHNDVW